MRPGHLRKFLEIGHAVEITKPFVTYDHRITIPAGSVGLVGATRVPCVRYGSGFPFDEFACVDFVLKFSDLTPSQIAEAREEALRHMAEVPEGYERGIFENHCPFSLPITEPRHVFRCAVPYNAMRLVHTIPDAEWHLREVEQHPPVNRDTYWSFPFPWLAGLTHEQALARMENFLRLKETA